MRWRRKRWWVNGKIYTRKLHGIREEAINKTGRCWEIIKKDPWNKLTLLKFEGENYGRLDKNVIEELFNHKQLTYQIKKMRNNIEVDGKMINRKCRNRNCEGERSDKLVGNDIENDE